MKNLRDVAGQPEHIRWTDRSGERRLMRAALQDALQTVLGAGHGSKHSQSEKEALEWITSGDDRHPFTYERICDALGLDAGWLRSRVLAAKARVRAGGPVTGAAREAP